MNENKNTVKTRKKLKDLKLNRQKIKSLPFSKIIPNIATMLALCTGLSAIRFAMMGRFELAVVAIILASLLDAVDGRLARLLGTSSHFGAELDSLSDFVSFGVSPGVVLYLYILNRWDGWGWSVVLFFAICMALRLARFNTTLLEEQDNKDQEPWRKLYFTGVPAPAGALLALMPLIWVIAFGTFLPGGAFLHGIFMVLIGLLLISRIPTFSLKGKQIPARWVLPLMILVGLVITALINAFWVTLFLIGVAYLGTIPLSVLYFNRHTREE